MKGLQGCMGVGVMTVPEQQKFQRNSIIEFPLLYKIGTSSVCLGTIIIFTMFVKRKTTLTSMADSKKIYQGNVNSTKHTLLQRTDLLQVSLIFTRAHYSVHIIQATSRSVVE